MNTNELKQVLAKIHIGDKRDVDVVILRYWDELIGDLDVRDALEGVTIHRKETAAYLMPAHVIANAKRAKLLRERDERINGVRAIEPRHITLDRDDFERLTLAAIEAHRAGKAG